MHEDLRLLLNAYLDGELQGSRLREMTQHLASCEACQKDLKQLQQISDRLKSTPMPEFMPVERFVSNLNLRLPRQPQRDLPPNPKPLSWWLAPAGLLGVWFFLHTVFTLANMFTAVETTGLLGQAANWFGSGQQAVWYAAMTSLSGVKSTGLQTTLSLLNNLDIFSVNLLTGFLWQALIVLLYWGWLSTWWLRHRPQPFQIENASNS
jgi:anti-sigma factor RsiW